MKYIKLILLVFSLLLLPWAGNEAWAKEAEITDLRWTARNDGDPPFVRIVTDLTKAVQAEAAIDKSGKNFEVIHAPKVSFKFNSLPCTELFLISAIEINYNLCAIGRRITFGISNDKETRNFTIVPIKIFSRNN